MSEAKKREIYKNVVVDDLNFRIKKFDAFTGSYIFVLIATKALPMGIGSSIGVNTQSNIAISKSEFASLQKDCLTACEYNFNGSWHSVLNENGSFSLPELDYSPRLALGLTVHALVWNYADFFGEGRSNLLSDLFSGILPNMPTSAPTNTHQSSEDYGNNTSSGTEPTV